MSGEEYEGLYGDAVPDYILEAPVCGKCQVEMWYSYAMSGFRCPKCGAILDENDMDLDGQFIDLEHLDRDDIPPGCAACGGPYPLCREGCGLFNQSDSF